MCPEITFFGRTFPTYSLSAIIGFVTGVTFAALAGRNASEKTETAIYLYVFGALGALLGAKSLYLFEVFPALIRDFHFLLDDFAYFYREFFAGGMVFYGGLFGAIAAVFAGARFFERPASGFYPLLLPAMALFAGFGRIGCFLAGCCYGKETTSWIGVSFSASPYAPQGVKLIPTQLLEAGFDFVLFVVIIVLTRSHLQKLTLSIYLLSYAIFRFFLEFFRGDVERGIYAGLSISQWISLGVIGVVASRLVMQRQLEPE